MRLDFPSLLIFLLTIAAPLHAQTSIQTSIVDEIENISTPMITLRCAGWYEASTSWLDQAGRNTELASEALGWSESLERFGAQQLAGASDPDKEAIDLAAEAVHTFRELYLTKIERNIERFGSELGDDGVLETDMRMCLRLVKSTVGRGDSND